jgi:hypothetical protein
MAIPLGLFRPVKNAVVTPQCLDDVVIQVQLFDGIGAAAHSRTGDFREIDNPVVYRNSGWPRQTGRHYFQLVLLCHRRRGKGQ